MIDIENNMLDKFKLERTTLWSFPERGNWATHNSQYRGNFAPQIPRNIIEMYSEPGELVLDPMVGSGTTMIECKLLHRNGIGIDVNQNAVNLTREALDFVYDTQSNQNVYLGDVRELSILEDNSIDLICTHPPYLNLVTYSKGKIKEDLSNISNPQKFCNEFVSAIKEMYRVLKPNRYCAVLIGDTRKGCHYIPLSSFLMQKYLQNGFVLKENIIKAQHNCTYSNRWKEPGRKLKFYLIMHEHLFVFRKPDIGENIARLRWSSIPEDKISIIE